MITIISSDDDYDLIRVKPGEKVYRREGKKFVQIGVTKREEDDKKQAVLTFTQENDCRQIVLVTSLVT